MIRTHDTYRPTAPMVAIAVTPTARRGLIDSAYASADGAYRSVSMFNTARPGVQLSKQRGCVLSQAPGRLRSEVDTIIINPQGDVDAGWMDLPSAR